MLKTIGTILAVLIVGYILFEVVSKKILDRDKGMRDDIEDLINKNK